MQVGHAEESNEAKLNTFLRWLVITESGQLKTSCEDKFLVSGSP